MSDLTDNTTPSLKFLKDVLKNRLLDDPFVMQAIISDKRNKLINQKYADLKAAGPQNPSQKVAIRTKYKKDIDLLLDARDYSNELWLSRKQDKGFVFLPSRNTYTNMMVHGENNADSRKRLSFLNSGTIQVRNTDSNTSLSFGSEMAAGYLGPLRLSLSTAVTDAGGLDVDSAALASLDQNGVDSLVHRLDSIARARNSIQNLLASGGLGSFKVSLPLFWIGIGKSRPKSGGEEIPQVLITSNAFWRLNSQIPQLGKEISDPKFGNELGVEGVLAMNLAPTGNERVSEFRILGKAKLAKISGADYISTLGIKNTKHAGFFRFEGGLVLSDSFFISYTFSSIWVGSGADKSNIKTATLGVSFLNF